MKKLLKENAKTGLIERAIENWLINTNERNYQAAFCQALLLEGHEIIGISPHSQLEFGKDVVTIDKNNDCCAYQLKSGNINVKKWREISGEIDELIKLAPSYPSVDKSEVHKAFLVTNGSVSDAVKQRIDKLNEDNIRKDRHYPYLNVIDGYGLLKLFIDAQGTFIPKKVADFSSFLELYLADGTDFMQKDKFFDFLNGSVLALNTKQKSNNVHAISSSVILTTYILNPYQEKKNYFALFEAWTSLAACIIRYAYRTKMKKEDWRNSLALVVAEIERSLILLKKEVLEKEDFFEGDRLGDGWLLYRARLTLVLGAIAAFALYTQRPKEDNEQDKQLLRLLNNEKSNLLFWGESAFPYYFSIIKYLEIRDEQALARDLFDRIFLGIVKFNHPKSEICFANPYFSLLQIIESIVFEDLEEELNMRVNVTKTDFSRRSGSSYILKPMLFMGVRRGRRDLLENQWRKLSHITLEEFRPDKIEDTFLWNVKVKDGGFNDFVNPSSSQSWKALEKEAWDNNDVPSIYSEYRDILGFFVLVCPHRIIESIYKVLDADDAASNL